MRQKSEATVRSQAWWLLDHCKNDSRKRTIKRIADRYIANIRTHLKGKPFAILIPVEQDVYMR